MIDSFKKVNAENFLPIANAIGNFPCKFCDFSPFVILMWQEFYNTEYAVLGDTVVLKFSIDGIPLYAPLSNDIVKTVEGLLEAQDTANITLISQDDIDKLSKVCDITSIESNDDWSDYIYLHSELSTFSGKNFSGQRNHINKFVATVGEWQYEEINSNNLSQVLSFYKALISDTDNLDATAIYERDMLLSYLDKGYEKFKTLGGMIKADGEIVAFSFGEIIGDTLLVHVEKARRDIPGAYQMIVREFARHNPAVYINREEDMGLEGLRKSKLSYHPIRLERKYKINIKKRRVAADIARLS